MSYTSFLAKNGPSLIHGQGCLARFDIQQGEIIGAFNGKWLVLAMGEREPKYPRGLDGRYCIDVHRFRQDGKEYCVVLNPIIHGKTPIDRINHSDEPNCTVHGLAVVAAEDIPRGDELSIDYRTLDCTPLMFTPDYGEE